MKNRTYLLAAVEGVAAQGLAVQGVMEATLVSADLLLAQGRPAALAGLLQAECQLRRRRRLT